jgi:HAD superfamily hydrolase (TIGR01450 family)
VTLARGYDLIVFDLDGVVYVGNRAVPGAPETIRALAGAGTPVAYATNNASRRATEVAQVLTSLGLPARADDVVTSARATAELLAADLPSGAPVLPVGAPALREELAAAGLTPVAGAQDRPVAVVQGYGPDVGWALLAEACVAIRAGARWVVTNTDATMPSPRGPLPGNGALVAALRTALAGREPDTVVGKPEPVLFAAAAAHRGASRVLVVGDRLDTDIEGARRAGMDSLLVLTGVTSPTDLLAAPPHCRPTHVAADCAALVAPDARSRVPDFRDGACVAGPWQATASGDHLVLTATGPTADSVGLSTGETPGESIDLSGDVVDALRALARAAWECPEWTAIRAVHPAAERAISALGLGRYAAWSLPTP